MICQISLPSSSGTWWWTWGQGPWRWGHQSASPGRGTFLPAPSIKVNSTSKVHKYTSTHLVEARAQQPWDLLDEGVGGKESIILLGQSLNLLLVFVQLLQVVSRHEVDTLGLGLVAMLLVSQQANLELLAGNMLQPAREIFSTRNSPNTSPAKSMTTFT